MANCWAACLGNCGDKQSREHVISRSLFLGDTVTVQGFHWCKDHPVEIGIANLTAKILCKRHNSSLSPIDKCAAKAFDTMREMTRLSNVRGAMKVHRWNVKTYRANGPMLERWFLKTLINIAYGGQYAIGHDSSLVGEPSDRLVHIAFGLARFEDRAGLYTMARVGMKANLEDRVTFSPLMAPDRHLVAGFFAFRGVTFLLWLVPGGPPSLKGLFFNGEDVGNAQLLFQTLRLKVKVGKYLSHALNIDW